MRTTITINRELLDELVETTGEKSKSAALNRAAEEYVRREKLRNLKDFWLGIRVEDVRDEAKSADQQRERYLDTLRERDGNS
jgi:metal-responsive CopG/Arc/MetJ family transcriptional regulator